MGRGCSNVSENDRKAGMSLAPFGGDIALGALIIVVRTERAPLARTSKRESAGHGSAGRNWSVFLSSHW